MLQTEPLPCGTEMDLQQLKASSNYNLLLFIFD